MEVKGILKACVNSQSGVSQRTGNKWRTDEWLVVIPGQYERKINFEVRGEDRCKQWQDFFEGMPDKNAPVRMREDTSTAYRLGTFASANGKRLFQRESAYGVALASLPKRKMEKEL